MEQLLIKVACLVVALLAPQVNSACHEVPPVAIDEGKIRDSIPSSKGYFTPMADRISTGRFTSLITNLKRDSMSIGPTSRQDCLGFALPKAIANAFPGRSYLYAECSYERMERQLCQLKMNKGLLTFAIPRQFKFTIVKTDNTTYAATVICISGTLETWVVLATTAQGPPPDIQADILNYYKSIGVDVSTANQKDGFHPAEISIVDVCPEQKKGLLSGLASFFGLGR